MVQIPGVSGAGAPLGGEGEVVAGEGAEHGVAEVAVDAALAAVVAGGHGQDLLVAGVAVQVDRLVAVAGGEQHHAALAPATLGDRVVDGQPGAVGQRGADIVAGVGRVEPAAVHRPPAAGDDVGPVAGRPEEGVGLLLGPELGDHPDRHQPGPGRDPGGPGHPVGAGNAGAGGAVVLAGQGPRVVVAAGGVPGRHDLAGAGKLLVVDVDAGVDDRHRHLLALGQGVGRGHVGAGADALPADRGRGQVPLLREQRPPAQPADQLGVGVLDVVTLQQPLGDGEDLLPGALGGGGEEGVGGVRELVLDPQPGLQQRPPAVLHRPVVAELHEQVLGVQHRLPRRVDQHLPGEPGVGRLLQRLLDLGHRPPGPVPPPVHLDPDLRELQHQLHPVQHRRLRPGHRPLPERPPASRPDRHQVRVDLQLQPLPLPSPVHHLGHTSLLPRRSERSA